MTSFNPTIGQMTQMSQHKRNRS